MNALDSMATPPRTSAIPLATEYDSFPKWPHGDPPYLDPEFDKRGYGMLNPFKRYLRKCDEEVNMSNVRPRSHDNWTFHKELPYNFDRRAVLPPE